MDWFNRSDVAVVIEKGPLRVSELSAIIEGLLDNPLLQDILVRGELTNYTHHARGHRYFSLSEKGGGNTAAVIKCVMWRSDADKLSFIPSEGMEVIVAGTVRAYAPHGSVPVAGKGTEKGRAWRKIPARRTMEKTDLPQRDVFPSNGNEFSRYSHRVLAWSHPKQAQ